MKKIAVLMALLASCAAAQARVRAIPSSTDPHFQSVPYTNEIVEIVVKPGRFVEIELDAKDTDLRYGIGDKEAWQIKVIDNIFAFKAKATFADTNLKIWSSKTKRVYWFNIVMAKKNASTPDLWHLSIDYPPDPPKAPKPPTPPDPQVVAIQLAEQEHALVESLLTPANSARQQAPEDVPVSMINGNYGIIGPEELTPTSVYDNGEQTVMTFAPNQPMPTIFVKESDGSETRVSKHVENDMLVVHVVARKFVLRRNGQAACLINGSFNPTGPNRRTNTVSSAVVRELKKDDE